MASDVSLVVVLNSPIALFVSSNFVNLIYAIIFCSTLSVLEHIRFDNGSQPFSFV